MQIGNKRTFESAIQAHNIVFVVGAGVSAGASGGKREATWRGLIENGIERCFALGIAGADEKWRDACQLMLEVDSNASGAGLMISAASQVALKLKASEQAYADWLAETVGTLPIENSSTIDALRASKFPILTTNYDTLIESSNGSSVTWREATRMQEVIAGESDAIGHLHGVWNDPESIILAEADYAVHSLAKGIQALQQAACSIKTLVYIGYGSGLEDPNFEQLLRWQRETFAASSRQHFRLCRESEVDALRRAHVDDNIIVESYGETYDALPDFLQEKLRPTVAAASLTPAGKVRDLVAEAKIEFEEAMRTHAVVLFPTAGEPEGSAPIVPPPLLPVPYAAYVERRSDKKDTAVRSERLEPSDVARSSGITVIASEEGGGLTTALRWLALQASESSAGSTPIYLPFNQCANRSTPVFSALRPKLRSRGLLNGGGGPLPPLILALDDAHAYGPVARMALSELVRLEIPQIFIGCRVGDEEEILGALRAAGAQPTVRYLGRFETKDVTTLLTVVAPGQVEYLIGRVVDAFVRTNLPRTPITVASIIYILLHGDSAISSTASQSSILEQYVSILLGQGNPLEDARLGIEVGGRQSVLASLAAYFVEKNSQVLAEGEVIARFGSHLARVGWKESETSLLQNFIRRGILRKTDGGIEFQHNSFVYLFSAKRAMTHQEFLEALLVRPLYYARIIQVYAGLARSNPLPLAGLIERYSEKLHSTGVDQGPPFAPIRPGKPPKDGPSSQTGDQVAASNRRQDVDGGDSGSGEAQSLTPLDYPEPLLPLFAEDAELPLLAEMERILDLLSSVIRDADQIEDAPLKRRALRVILEGWGHFISAFSHGVSIRDLVESLFADESETEGRWSDAQKSHFSDLMERILPVAATISGMAYSLKSRTLLVPLEHEIEQDDFQSPELVIAAALLLVTIRERGWPAQVMNLYRRSPNHSVWVDYFRFDLERCFMSREANEDDREAALEGVIEIRARSFRFDSAGDATKYRDRLRSDMRRRRLESETVGRMTGRSQVHPVGSSQ